MLTVINEEIDTWSGPQFRVECIAVAKSVQERARERKRERERERDR